MAEIKQRGGRRPGAGRKPGSSKQTYVGSLKGSEDWFDAPVFVDGVEVPRWQKFLLNLERLADGHFKQDIDKETNTDRIYWISPDRTANQYLLDRKFGKPIQKEEHTGSRG